MSLHIAINDAPASAGCEVDIWAVDRGSQIDVNDTEPTWAADFRCNAQHLSPNDMLVVCFIRTIPKPSEAVQALIMRAGIVVNVTRADRHRLEAIVSDRSAPQKHVWRANIILATADGCGTAEIMRRSGKSKPVVWRWQARFMAEGVEGLTRDKTRKPGKQPLPTTTVQRVVDLTLGPPPGEATHWTGRLLAKAAGVSLRSVQRILEAHQLAPHRIRTFKLSNDPKFAEKLNMGLN